MNAFGALMTVTVRGLLGRRRLLLMLLLVAIPVVLGTLLSLRGGRADVDRVLGILMVQTVMPLVALILGTATLGSEIEDGTVVYLLIKPIQRWIVALAKIVVAVAATIMMVVPATVLTGLLIGGLDADSVRTTFAFAVACILGGSAYAALFVALSSLTSRALVGGLIYVLLWESALGGLLEGTRFLSIRQATLGIAGGLGGRFDRPPIDPEVAFAVLTITVLASLLVASWRLARFEIKGAD